MAAAIARFWQTSNWSFGRFCRSFSELHWTSFDAAPLERRLVDRLNDLNIKTLTEIQQKCLGTVMKGDNVIINAETGSGKTLCYLIPVLNSLLRKSPKQQSPSALVLVPNMDLGYQITELFNQLCDPGFVACPVHRDSPLRINENYPVIVSTPQSLLHYNLVALSAIQTVIVDEADLIISNGGKQSWKLLKSLRDQASNGKPKQFIFVAATLPQRGAKSVFNQIRKWFPDVVHVTSSMVHQCVPSLTSVDVFINDEEKLPQLLKHLNVLNRELPIPLDGIAEENDLRFFGESQRNKHLKILVFANTIAMSRSIFEFLNSQEGTTFEVLDKKTAGSKKDESHGQCLVRHKLQRNCVESWIPNKAFDTETGSTLPWQHSVGLLHKEMSMVERQDVLKKFKSNQITVLVSTDLASRGLDIPDVTHVIQLDYAHNASDVLHRVGRTARAGARGTVINFITAKDHDLWRATQLTRQGHGTEGFQEIFSRNRMFSRRIKRKLKITQK